MAEVTLGSIRIGFSWSVDIDYPTGFLDVGESILMKLRRYPGDTTVQICTDNRTGDTVTLNLSAAQTANMLPGAYIGEAVVYKPADPTYDKIPLTRNCYVVEVDHSPSE